MTKKKHSLAQNHARPNDPAQKALLLKVKAYMKKVGIRNLSVVEDLKVLDEHARLVKLGIAMQETADRLAQVTAKIETSAVYKRLKKAEDKKNEKQS